MNFKQKINSDFAFPIVFTCLNSKMAAVTRSECENMKCCSESGSSSEVQRKHFDVDVRQFSKISQKIIKNYIYYMEKN